MTVIRIPHRQPVTHHRPGQRRLAAWAGAAMLLALSGCSILGGGSREPVTIYAPDPHLQADPSWPQVPWQLAIATPSAARIVDSTRIAVRPTADELQVYKGARWAQAPSDQLEDAVLHALEDSGRIGGVARQESGIAADFKLVMDLRRYEADYAGAATPKATIEVSAKLLRSIDQSVVAARIFQQAVPAAGTDTQVVAQAFGQALGTIGHDIAGWTLANGQAHESGQASGRK